MQREPNGGKEVRDPREGREHDRPDDDIGNVPPVPERLRRVDHRGRSADDSGERRNDDQHVVDAAWAGIFVAAGIPLFLADSLAQRRGQLFEPTRVERGNRDIGNEDEQSQHERRPGRKPTHDEQAAEHCDENRDRAVQHEAVAMDANLSRDHRRKTQQRSDVEDVRADDHADTGIVVTRHERCNRRRDFRPVRAERRHDSEQGL